MSEESLRGNSAKPREAAVDERGALRVFAYLTTEKAAIYRAVMGAFMEAKAHFVLHLRPIDVGRALVDLDSMADAQEDAIDAESMEPVLRQLVEWGNLRSHNDTTDVATVEDFYRPRYLYQLTAEGEAAERAVTFFEEEIRTPGELKIAALSDIRALLEELAQLAEAEPLDDGKVHRTLDALRSRFESLTARAQAFIGSLQRTIDLHELAEAEFLEYKNTLIDYLERFIGELVLATADITDVLDRLDTAGVDRLLAAAARREASDAMAPEESEANELLAWRRRWRGLTTWFVGEQGPSQAELLRSRARAAIPALLGAIAAIHDRKATRSDRSTDLVTLAHWFAEADSEADAHRLWRAAFGLAPSRHLRVDEATLALWDAEGVPAQTSWLDAPPLRLTPRLRATGRSVRRGPPKRVVDRSREKALIAARAREEIEQLAAARRRFDHGRPLRLSEIGTLAREEFAVFLDLLGEALAHGARGTTTSSDGILRIELTPTRDGRTATIHTEAGRLHGPDHVLRVRSTIAPPSPGDDDRIER